MNNITINSTVEVLSSITKECFNWCKGQHFANDYQNLWIFALVLIALCVAHVIFKNSDIVSERTGYTEDQLAMIVMHLIDFGILAITGFFVWFLFFQ